MKKLLLGFFSLTILVSCSSDDSSSEAEKTDYFAVANRGSGSVTIYNADTQTEKTTITIGDADSSPTYVTYSKERDILYVAEFNNQKIIAYNAETFAEVEEYPTDMGSFHMWLNDNVDQLWVNNIVSKTVSVINLSNGSTLQTLTLPNTITFETDAAQHDVILSPNGSYAYVSIFSQTGTNYVLQYNTSNFSLINSVEVGGDPHLTVTDDYLYILSQDDSSITEYNLTNLSPTGNSGSMANAHGVTVGNNDNIFLTNISERKVGSYNTNTQVTNSVTDAGSTAGVAHNIAYSSGSSILALTLSGSNTVDFFSANGTNISFLSSDNSGENPFGIVFMDR